MKKFDWQWYLSELNPDKDITVFSTFSCGGGSSMGYKKAGFKVIGNVEIDPRVNRLYVENLHPKYNFLMDLREFNKIPNDQLPEELFHLDILDGSPPCSTFSTAGKREKGWGVEKVFREGQTAQRLDDLFFVFLDTVEKLRPRVVVAENVTGLLQGNAKGYVTEIVKRFQELGYSVQLFKLNAAFMDCPQARERVFFIANRENFPKLHLDFNCDLIPFGDVRTKESGKTPSNNVLKYLAMKHPGDLNLSHITKRVGDGNKLFGDSIFWDNRIAFTITSAGHFLRACDNTLCTDRDLISIQTFPQDYSFFDQDVQYVCGMSVPPNMTAHIAIQIWEQWLSKDKEATVL